MRKWICLFLVVILTLCISSNLIGVESLLIDFDKLKANGDGQDPANSLEFSDAKMVDYTNHEENRKEHMPTLVDYSGIAGTDFYEEDLKGMKISLAAHNWHVELNSSAAHIPNRAKSYCIEWHTKFRSIFEDITATAEGGDAPQNPEGFTILGVRIKFPVEYYNNWALIKPPFEIPAWEDIETDVKGNALSAEEKERNMLENYGSKFDGYGVVKNVGAIKSIAMTVYGNQYKNSISLLLKDENGTTTEYHMPRFLDYDGWRRLTWTNPNYIEDVANREIFLLPLYPRDKPFVKLIGFRVYRPGDQLGGDFITYIKDVKVTHDLAILDRDRPIEHEQAWGILKDRTKEAKIRELTRLGDGQILQFLERKKMHKETSSE
jgi:hypothetical protein